MPSTTVSKIPLPTPEELRRVEAVLGFVFNEIEGLQGALQHAETSAAETYEVARREGVPTDEACTRAAAVSDALRLQIDDETAGRLFMFLFDVIDALGDIESMARDCQQKVKYARHDNPAGYDLPERIRIQEVIAAFEAGGDDS